MQRTLRNLMRVSAAAGALLFFGACSPDLQEDECRVGDPNACAFKAGTVCSPEGWCVLPESIRPDLGGQGGAGGGAGGVGGGAGGVGGGAGGEGGGAGGEGGGAGGEGGGAGGEGGGAGGEGGGAGGGAGGAGGGAGGEGGGAGGAGGGAGGEGGMGGEGGGAGGEGGGMGDGPRFCQESCEDAGDCIVGFTCEGARCVPAEPAAGCEGDAECQAIFSGWAAACATQEDCPGQVCVVFGDGGVCATAPNEFFSCDQALLDELETRSFPEDEAVTVCAQTRARCNATGDAAFCELRCADDSHCGGEYPRCEVDTGRCVCTADSCETNASVCGDNGICRCAADADCDAGNVDTCYDGICGCSEVTICPDMTVNPGTTMVCEGFPAR